MSPPRSRISPSTFVVAAAVLLPVGYFLSVGPAAWAYERWEKVHGEVPVWAQVSVRGLYFPVMFVAMEGPEWLSGPIVGYMKWWTEQ